MLKFKTATSGVVRIFTEHDVLYGHLRFTDGEWMFLPCDCRLYPGRELSQITEWINAHKSEPVLECREMKLGCRLHDGFWTVYDEHSGVEVSHSTLSPEAAWSDAAERLARLVCELGRDSTAV